jgi:hypothetical protein
MKCSLLIKLFLELSLIILPGYVFAGWQVTRPQAAIPASPFFQAGTQTNSITNKVNYSNTAFPKRYAKIGPDAPVYAISVSGSIKENLERIMGRYNWKVIWKAPYDYNFDGRVAGGSLANVIEKLMQPFPLQAVMYMSNRTLIVLPRYKKDELNA